MYGATDNTMSDCTINSDISEESSPLLQPSSQPRSQPCGADDQDRSSQPRSQSCSADDQDRSSCRSQINLMQLSLFIFTDWPLKTVSKTVKAIAHMEDQELEKNPAALREGGTECSTICKCTPDCKDILCISWLIIRFLGLVIAITFQLLICFRRDRVSIDLVEIDNTSIKRLSCDKTNEVVCGILIPDIVAFLLAVWVYIGLKFWDEILKCCGCICSEKSNTIIKADTAERLNKLV